MTDADRIDRLEEKVEAAGTPTDEPHHEMAQDVAEATVEAGAVQQRRMMRDFKWLVIAAVILIGLALVLFR